MPKKFFKVDFIPALRRLEVLSKSLVNPKMISAYKSTFKGKGLEFSDYRGYTPGDDISLIDWRASAKTNKILIKQYAEERDVDVFFLVDCSTRMLFGSIEKLKAEYVIELTTFLSYAVLEAGDCVGLALCSDDVKAYNLPSKGKVQFYNISKLLLNTNYYQGGILDLKNAVKFIFNYLKKTAVVIIISDFIDWRDDWEKSLKLLKTKFDVICVMVRDPRDRTLPTNVGEVVIQDPKTGKTLLIEPGLIKQAYEDEVKEQENKIRKILFKTNVDFVEMLTDKSFVRPIMDLFLKRSLKWR